MFFVSVDSKELSFSVSSLFSTLTSRSISVDSERLRETGRWDGKNEKCSGRKKLEATLAERLEASWLDGVKRGKPRTCREGGKGAVRDCEVASTRQDSTRV